MRLLLSMLEWQWLFLLGNEGTLYYALYAPKQLFSMTSSLICT